MSTPMDGYQDYTKTLTNSNGNHLRTLISRKLILPCTVPFQGSRMWWHSRTNSSARGAATPDTPSGLSIQSPKFPYIGIFGKTPLCSFGVRLFFATVGCDEWEFPKTAVKNGLAFGANKISSKLMGFCNSPRQRHILVHIVVNTIGCWIKSYFPPF